MNELKSHWETCAGTAAEKAAVMFSYETALENNINLEIIHYSYRYTIIKIGTKTHFILFLN